MTGRVPHFELVFFLTMEAFGKVHPSHRSYHQWVQMEEKERALHRRDMADLYLATAERFEHNAIFLHPNPNSIEETCRLIELIRERSGDRYFLMRHGDATFELPNGAQLVEFAYRLADEPEKVHAEAQAAVDGALQRAEEYAKHGGLDGFALCSDYCFNTGPFLSPAQFGEFVTPYLAKLIKGYRDLGFYMAEIKRLAGAQVCLIGNVNCGLVDTGTDEQVIESTRYALRHGMPGGGYVFSTSNCIYTGMRLARYELMLDIWRREGNYPPV